MSDASNEQFSKWMALANSPAGKNLLEYVKQHSNSELDHAMENAKQGDYSDAVNALRKILNTPEGSDLIRKIRGET